MDVEGRSTRCGTRPYRNGGSSVFQLLGGQRIEINIFRWRPLFGAVSKCFSIAVKVFRGGGR